MPKCPTCERPFNKIWDYPRVKILRLEKRKLPSDLSVIIHDNSPEITDEVKQAFEIRPVEVDESGWQRIRCGEWNWKRIFEGDSDIHELFVHFNIDGRNVIMPCDSRLDYMGLRNHLESFKDGIPITLESGHLFYNFFYNVGGEKRRLDMLKLITPEQAENLREILGQEKNIRLTRIEERDRFSYHRFREDGLSILMPYVNQYFERIEGLIGKEVDTNALIFNTNQDRESLEENLRWAIPNSYGFRLSFEEFSEFGICSPGTAYIAITHNDFSRGFNIDISDGKYKFIPSKDEGKNSPVLVATMDYEGLINS